MVVSNMGIKFLNFFYINSKLYGFAATSTIQYCKSILATLIRDAVIDKEGAIKYILCFNFSISQTRKQGMRNLIIRIEKMEVLV